LVRFQISHHLVEWGGDGIDRKVALAQIILNGFADQRRDVETDFLPRMRGVCVFNEYDHTAGLCVHVYIVPAEYAC
jgi:hypothetical protein